MAKKKQFEDAPADEVESEEWADEPVVEAATEPDFDGFVAKFAQLTVNRDYMKRRVLALCVNDAANEFATKANRAEFIAELTALKG